MMPIETSPTFFDGGLEFLNALQTEVCLFGLASLIYVLFSMGVFPFGVHAQKNSKVKNGSFDGSDHTKCRGDVDATAKPWRRPHQPGQQCRGPVCAVQPSKVDKAKLIRTYGKEGKLDAAISSFEGMKQEGSATNSLSYNSVLEACVHCGDMSSALKYLAEATELKVADAVTHNTVMKGHLASHNIVAAWQLLADMKKLGVSPSHHSYHSLLHSSAQTKDRRAAWRCITQMSEEGLKPTAITCTILLKLITASVCTPADMPRVMALVDGLEDPMDEALFTSLVETCLQTRNLDLLTRKLQDCKAKGSYPKLSAPAYGAMIKAYGQARNVTQVWSMWNEMIRADVQPTMVTLGCMVEALVMNASADHALQLTQELWEDENQRHMINTVIYATILKGFAIAKRMDKVLALYGEMRERNVECNTITYNTLLNALVLCNEMKRIPQILEDMRTASPSIEPDKITYSTIMKGYCCSGELDKGLALLKDIEESALFVPDEVMFNSLLDGCAKQQRLDDGLLLMDKMRAASVVPSNYTLSIMIKLLGRTKQLNKAFSLVKDLSSEHGFRPNIFVYTCLIQACFHNKQLAKALALHDEVVIEGCLFDEKAYTSLAQGCIRAGAPEKAADVVRCAFGLSGSSLRCGAEGKSAPGVDPACLQEVCAKLSSSRTSGGAQMAQRLLSDVESKRNGTGSRPREAPRPRAPWYRPSAPSNASTSTSSNSSDVAVSSSSDEASE